MHGNRLEYSCHLKYSQAWSPMPRVINYSYFWQSKVNNLPSYRGLLTLLTRMALNYLYNQVYH